MYMNLVGTGLWFNEDAQIDAWVAIRRKAHDFPFVGIRSKAKKFREARVKKPERVRPVDGFHVLQAPLAASPDRSGFPGAASVHDDNCGFIEAGIRIGAQRMSEMMIDKAKACFAARELLRKALRPAFLVMHAQKMQRRIARPDK